MPFILRFCDDDSRVFPRAIVICLVLHGGDSLVSWLTIDIRFLLRNTDSRGCFDHPLIDDCFAAFVIICLLLCDADFAGLI